LMESMGFLRNAKEHDERKEKNRLGVAVPTVGEGMAVRRIFTL
jgi:hypothetical protein